MLFWTTIKLAFRSLLANKLRSILTMLGMIIGVAAVIAMLALGNGAKAQIMKWVSRMGKNTITVFPHNPRIAPVLNGAAKPLTLRDAHAILAIPGVKYVSPVVTESQPVKWGNYHTYCNIIGCASTYIIIHDFKVQSGQMFNYFDVRDMASVAVIGPETAERLFGSQNPLGHTITVGTVRFKVIGVLVPKGRQGWFDPDNQVLLPYTTAMTKLMGRQVALNHIDIQVQHAVDLAPVQNKIQTVLRIRHSLIAGDSDDFWISNQLQIIKVTGRISEAFTFLLGSVASISLLIGGIGIMNIMLVTVTERTREIGIRKAIGARRRDILRQFLIESMLVSLLGGLIGVGVGVIAARYVKFRNFSGVVEPHMIFLALFISAGIGIFFGYYPARRAARLNPIEALRYE